MKKVVLMSLIALMFSFAACTEKKEKSETEALIEEMEAEGADVKVKTDGDETKIKMETETKEVKIKTEDGETKVKVSTDDSAS